MDKLGRWVSKDVALADKKVSLSTLDRMITRGEVEAVRQDGRVFVLVHGPEPVSDTELLERAREDLAECEVTMSSLRIEIQGLQEDLSRQSLRESRTREETNRAQNRAYDLERRLCEERRDRRSLMRALIVISVSAAILFVLNLF